VPKVLSKYRVVIKTWVDPEPRIFTVEAESEAHAISVLQDRYIHNTAYGCHPWCYDDWERDMGSIYADIARGVISVTKES
jgi:hypothetical protein